ncbi:hypothetical protein [Pelagibius sp. Alg239-R121]|uniref:hypothetical protein n=1 Tax=Pelagibius sp. Alg239-R121 TaxID=2993448 RepID=UPI0024A7076F|nr:hypothetical protein [Pelagibius sp. Alg239-R121]
MTIDSGTARKAGWLLLVVAVLMGSAILVWKATWNHNVTRKDSIVLQAVKGAIVAAWDVDEFCCLSYRGPGADPDFKMTREMLDDWTEDMGANSVLKFSEAVSKEHAIFIRDRIHLRQAATSALLLSDWSGLPLLISARNSKAREINARYP